MTYQFRCVNGNCEYMSKVVDRIFSVKEISDAKPKCDSCGTIMNRVYTSVGIVTNDNTKGSK